MSRCLDCLPLIARADQRLADVLGERDHWRSEAHAASLELLYRDGHLRRTAEGVWELAEPTDTDAYRRSREVT